MFHDVSALPAHFAVASGNNCNDRSTGQFCGVFRGETLPLSSGRSLSHTSSSWGPRCHQGPPHPCILHHSSSTICRGGAANDSNSALYCLIQRGSAHISMTLDLGAHWPGGQEALPLSHNCWSTDIGMDRALCHVLHSSKTVSLYFFFRDVKEYSPSPFLFSGGT